MDHKLAEQATQHSPIILSCEESDTVISHAACGEGNRHLQMEIMRSAAAGGTSPAEDIEEILARAWQNV
jgi:hypothetical protein